jgi:hypothetical protein
MSVALFPIREGVISKHGAEPGIGNCQTSFWRMLNTSEASGCLPVMTMQRVPKTAPWLLRPEPRPFLLKNTVKETKEHDNVKQSFLSKSHSLFYGHRQFRL